jgi:2-phosphoglycerate kinase
MAMLDHVRLVGGGTGAGKSTVTRRIAERFGLAIYSTDAATGVHSAKLSPTMAPLLEAFRRMSMDERWVRREPAEMYRTFPWFQGEGFDLLIEDLRSLPTTTITLVEGFRLLPHLARPHISQPHHAIWLIPTPRFRRAAFASRDRSDAFWLRTGDPERALENLLARDQMFTTVIAGDAERNEMKTLAVDGERTVEDTVSAVAKQFGLLD